MQETFKAIPNFGRYVIGDFGTVKKISNIGRDGYISKERIMKSHLDGKGYKFLRLTGENGRVNFKIHQLIAMAFLNHIPCGHKLVVDHINHIKTDNRLKNIRIITQRQNSNQKHIKSSSQYTGVTWHNQCNKWYARIVIHGKLKSIGLFKDEYQAHLAYQKALTNL